MGVDRVVLRSGSGVAAGGVGVGDGELLRRCGEGDGDAWRLLVERYQRLVFSVALRNGLCREDAADVTQLTFVALLDSFDQIRGGDRLGSWLMTVARRQAWRFRRRVIAEQGVVGPVALVDDSVGEWERLAWLHGGLGQLGGPCRELLEALYFDLSEPSYAEVAVRLGRAVGSLGSMRARCLVRLRKILEEEEGGHVV